MAKTKSNERCTVPSATEPITKKSGILEDVRRFFRFGIVGGLGILVNMGFYALLHDLVGIYDPIAGAIAIELSILNNFTLNERWTFRDRSWGGWKVWIKRCVAFHLSSGLVAMFTQLVTLYVLTRFMGIWDKLAYLIGIALGAVANYFICSRWIFKSKKETPST